MKLLRFGYPLDESRPKADTSSWSGPEYLVNVKMLFAVRYSLAEVMPNSPWIYARSKLYDNVAVWNFRYDPSS